MLEGLLRVEPHLRVHHQELLHEVEACGRDPRPAVLPHVVLPRPDGADLLPLGGAAERHVADKEDEDDDAQTPEVALGGVALAEDLRGHVGEGAAAQLHLRVLLPDLAEPEVDELQEVGVLPLVEEVLQFQVPVHDPAAVDVVHGQQHLPGGVGRVPLLEPLLLLNAVKELAARHALHDECQFGVALVDGEQPADVRVVQLLYELDLGLPLLGTRLGPAGELHGALRARLLVPGLPHDRARPVVQEAPATLVQFILPLNTLSRVVLDTLLPLHKCGLCLDLGSQGLGAQRAARAIRPHWARGRNDRLAAGITTTLGTRA
mmetsp:Transcript_88532/g.275055  ORF Transcript_88532/g.275055 Transcript_88532/m.275055 type:complete len:319 (-) Transcript_88532:3-959(-)